MAPSKLKIAKRYIKFLEICPDSKAINIVIRSSPDKVIKVLCNAAVKIYCGDIALTKKQKQLFSKIRKLIKKLGDIEVPLEGKRRTRLRNKNIISAIISTCYKLFGDKILK